MGARVLGVVLVGVMAAGVRADDAAARELFEKRIRPVLVKHCYECHSSAAREPKGGLRLDTRAGVQTGADTGPIVVPGKPDESSLMDALRHVSSAKMPPPPGKKLPDDVIADFARWIELGAVDPRTDTGDADRAGELAWEAQYQERIGWWSLQAVTSPVPPDVKNVDWPAQPLDRFILAKLEQQGISPAPRADRRTLVRRLSFALTGLPPSIDLVEDAVADKSPAAWERLVERLLASPHFGERWARHWMDVVRYSDTYGYEWDVPAKGAWRYRDYLVQAFNSDLPYDAFVREQIAGDLLEKPRLDLVEGINQSKIGPMFYQLGEKRHGDSSEFNGIHQEMLDNKIDAFSKAFQAVTVSCARCHDHKLDAVSQKDYYALAGIFLSSRWVTNTVDLPSRHAAGFQTLKSIKSRLRQALARSWRDQLSRWPAELLAQAATPPKEEGQIELESLRAPWKELVKAHAAQKSIAETWTALAKRWTDNNKARADLNARDFVLLADFSKGVPTGWSVDGVGLREPVRNGDFTVPLSGPTAIGRILQAGLFTNAFSPRMNGAVRTPPLNTIGKPNLSVEVCGGDFAAQRTVIDNAFLTEKQQYLNQPALGWLRVSTMPQFPQRKIYWELATKTSNPNFPPRVGLGGACSEAQATDPRSWFGISRVYASEANASAVYPWDELTRFLPLFVGQAPTDLPAAAERYVDWCRQAVVRWEKDEATVDDVKILNTLLNDGILSNTLEQLPEIAALVAAYRTHEPELPTPATVNGMLDVDTPFDYALNVRGDYDDLGPAVPRGWLRMLSLSDAQVPRRNASRLELAERVAHAGNPLTARVFVNRVWHWLFGAGLVTTMDDFGHLGDKPSHPELLDYLASRFMNEGWSVKQLIREIVLSETWRQSNVASDAGTQLDPDNRLVHHYPLRRLEAEAIRDAMLAASGRLRPELGGPPIDPHRANEDPQKRLFSGPVDGLGRRSLYTKLTIMEPPKFLAAFNQPSPKIPTGRRDVTNTPAQSLALLNDPLVRTLADQWAAAMVSDPRGSVDRRLVEMFEAALGRTPEPEELSRWQQAVTELSALHNVSTEGTLASRNVWRDVAHAMFNLKEFLTVR